MTTALLSTGASRIEPVGKGGAGFAARLIGSPGRLSLVGDGPAASRLGSEFMEEAPTMIQFIGPVLDRHQSFLLRDTLEESIPRDHPVRVYDFVLDQHDWDSWNALCAGWGRPPYAPVVMCKLLVYGYRVGIRSSRALEHACRNNVDFIWLMAGRAPDHDTIANFRREHRKDFKRVFATSVAACEEAGMVSLANCDPVAVGGGMYD